MDCPFIYLSFCHIVQETFEMGKRNNSCYSRTGNKILYKLICKYNSFAQKPYVSNLSTNAAKSVLLHHLPTCSVTQIFFIRKVLSKKTWLVQDSIPQPLLLCSVKMVLLLDALMCLVMHLIGSLWPLVGLCSRGRDVDWPPQGILSLGGGRYQLYQSTSIGNWLWPVYLLSTSLLHHAIPP